MKPAVFAAVLYGLALACASPAGAATRIDLDHGWQFRADREERGVERRWESAVPPDTQEVTLPHTWNIGALHDMLGVGWYFRRFDAPPLPPSGRLQIHFGATFYSARIWLNGREIGAHEGGFTAYAFDITRGLRASNLIAVRIDNRPGIATIPGFAERGTPGARYDWWTYGGMVREAWLTTTGAVGIERQTVRAEAADEGARISDRVHLQSALPGPRELELRIRVRDAGGADVASESRRIAVAAGASDVEVVAMLAHPERWSIDRPYLYRVDARLETPQHAPLDERSDSFGVRSIEIRDRRLYVNGERVRLTGMARHEDSPWEGLAETAGTMRHDLDDMKALHTTLTRPVHYPQNPFVLDYADRHGILLIPEIPIWQFSAAQLADPKVLALAQRQMREMITEAANHPSIFAWSVANESAMHTPEGIAFFRAMRAMIRELDPGRYVSFADDNLGKIANAEISAANDADFLMMNQYYGSWHGPAAALEGALDRVDALFPHKMVIISEMGFAGLFANGPVQADQARVKLLEEQMPRLAARDWIAGTILWCYQDYKSPRNLWPGETEGFVEHGLVDEWRQRKPSYATWQHLTSPAKITAHWVTAGANDAVASSPAAFAIEAAPNSERELPFYSLRGYRLNWKLADAQGQPLAAGVETMDASSNPLKVTGAVPPAASGEDRTLRLTATLVSPQGNVAADEVIDWQGTAPIALLWPGGAPGSEGRSGAETLRINEHGEHIISNVNAPSLGIYLPARSSAGAAAALAAAGMAGPTRAGSAATSAVIVIPGGGHQELWIDHEGVNVARFLTQHGIAAFVLKYRLAHAPGSKYSIEGDELADVQRAIRLVRSRAAEWGIDPNRVGVLGFSAGGELAALAATRAPRAATGGVADAGRGDPVDAMSSKPRFAALLYPAIPKSMPVSSSTPALFLAAGSDDKPAISQGLAQLYLEARRAGAEAELHIYAGVAHGFGLRAENHGAERAWPDQFLVWLKTQGMAQ
jgi:beta-glucuronidase